MPRSSPSLDPFDVIVIGAGPAGQKAAIQMSKSGRRTLIIERGANVGGECVEHGTIPSKTLRETAVYLAGLGSRSEGMLAHGLRPDLKLESLVRRQTKVRDAHQSFIAQQLERNNVTVWTARARFAAPTVVEALGVDGSLRAAAADTIFIATGSRPRSIPEIDHEHVLDSDSILSLIYLPRSLTVLGGGVIASEFASIFAALGVTVTMVDRSDRPVAFMDPELTDHFVAAFERSGGRYLHGRRFTSIEVDGQGGVRTVLEGGEEVRSDKLLCALGRVAAVRGLALEAAGLSTNERGHIDVDTCYRTLVPGIYAVGDVIGPPALAATAMEQGRRAARHALGEPTSDVADQIPVGIYTIPEMSSVGLTEAQAREAGKDVLVGRARFAELARGHITGAPEGMLKLLVNPSDDSLLGVHIVGESATELVHLGQLAMIGGLACTTFVEHTFNFPTLAEAYRVAALDVAGQRIVHQRRAA